MKQNAILGNNFTTLVIGDVGSGKTYVAIVSALAYLKYSDHAKVALIAPTEVLAYQHYQDLIAIMNSLGDSSVDLLYLSSKNKLLNNNKLPPLALKNYIEDTKNKKVFAIGTHTVFNHNYMNFNLVMVDEQHRFGVNQRGIFSLYPHHFISFTATPIPRTLALSLFSKLNTQFIQRLNGRVKVETKIMSFDRIFNEHFYQYIQSMYIDKAAKIYIVCPKIEIVDTEDKVYSVDEVYQTISDVFPDQVSKLTGKSKNKKEILEDFKYSKVTNILVSTSVIEVGVDIQDARLMIILNSERFGLAALHQLRGRVGRNNLDDNQCILGVDKKYLNSGRLKVMIDTDDGFKIAQHDLSIRGTGDIAGHIQSGFSDEIETIMKVNETTLLELNKIVDVLDLRSLPRLKNYLDKKIENYHPE
jgi:ATP-dependent DNA helicase RecG